MSEVERYHEPSIEAALRSLPIHAQVHFAAACADTVMQLYPAFVEATGQGDPDTLTDALELAWSARPGSPAPPSAVELQARCEDLVPHDDDDDWTPLSPIAQNAAASVAYALRTWISSSTQEAVWAARQLYEAADFLVQELAPEHDYVADTDDAPEMRIAIRRIAANAAAAAAAADTDQTQWRAAARADGEQLRTIANLAP